MRPLLMQTVNSEDLDEIASSLERVQVTWATAIAAGLIVIIAFVAGRVARRSIRELGERLQIASPDVFKLAGRTAAYLITLMGIGAALGVLGFDVIPLVSALGVLAIVLAIGLQPLIEDFAAGVTLQTRRPFETGDQVAILGIEGTVLDVTSRTVLIETVAGEYVHLPNRTVLDSPFTIFTALDARRSTLDVGLDYGSDLQHATELMREAAATTPGVVASPEVEVFIHEFGESTINASVWFWHDTSFRDAWTARHAVALNLKRALDAAGITIAFPQRVLWSGGGDNVSGRLG